MLATKSSGRLTITVRPTPEPDVDARWLWHERFCTGLLAPTELILGWWACPACGLCVEAPR